MADEGQLVLLELSNIDWGTVIVALISASVGIIGTYFSFRGRQKETVHLLVDQLQEERKAMSEELAKERALNKEIYLDKALSRQHVAELRHQINSGTPPPPVAPPPGYIE